jgi:anion-transporting  ArsA/GET3 family ATPase
MLDPTATLRQLIERDAATPDQAARILANPLFGNLSERLSGTNEYMAAERLLQLHLDDRFDRVVVDTPPSNHAFDFLDSPARLSGFLRHPLYRRVLGNRTGTGSGLFGGRSLWAQAMIGLLGRLVGGNLVTDVVDFFADFGGIDDGFRDRAAAIGDLLGSDQTAAVLVTTPRPDRLAEADWIVDQLRARQRPLGAVIINRVSPLDLAATAESEPPAGPLGENLRQLTAMAEHEQRDIARLLEGVGASAAVPSRQLAEQARPVADVEALVALASLLDG